MQMDIQMIGTGSAFAKSYYNNNALLYSGDRTLLIDCGLTAPMALHKLGVSFDRIDGILISHVHADHIGGLEELAFQYLYKYRTKVPLFLAEELAEPLWEHSLRGGLEQDGFRRLSDYFDVRLLTAGVPTDTLPGLRVELLRTSHVPDKLSYSMLFNDTFFYSADMVFSPALLEHLVRERGVETIFHDCQLHEPGLVHATLPELLTLPDDIQSRVRLMHYGDDRPAFEGKTGRMSFVDQHVIYSLN
ncbi:MBL fold metallo-hydrolase [Cohnella fermenti]|uniref:MBL fold metallo-hydrolase n=1 Tax=Cohnella fermenti TaxID=2565925 RepID=A0A4S4BHI0_9BACL|nr:MBL fold metallo-hydrolase [Cohnella fermenti]THF73876.1 MBL fold metallo-hydrolase [Cohnella fermenti]